MHGPRRRGRWVLALLLGASASSSLAIEPPLREDKPVTSPARDAKPASPAREPTIRDLIGQTVPPYPNGLQSNTGACIGSDQDEGGICGRSLGTLDDATGVTRHLYAAQSAGRRDDGQPLWRVLDIVTPPKPLLGEYLQIGTCAHQGESDGSIAALVDARGADEMVEKVRWAARLDRDTSRFVVLPLATVVCINEGYGE